MAAAASAAVLAKIRRQCRLRSDTKPFAAALDARYFANFLPFGQRSPTKPDVQQRTTTPSQNPSLKRRRLAPGREKLRETGLKRSPGHDCGEAASPASPHNSSPLQALASRFPFAARGRGACRSNSAVSISSASAQVMWYIELPGEGSSTHEPSALNLSRQAPRFGVSK